MNINNQNTLILIIITNTMNSYSKILSYDNIAKLENYIATHKPRVSPPTPSLKDKQTAIECWKKITASETPPTTYFQFGSNGWGTTSYGFYKTYAGQIITVVAYVNEIQTYCIACEDWEFLSNE